MDSEHWRFTIQESLSWAARVFSPRDNNLRTNERVWKFGTKKIWSSQFPIDRRLWVLWKKHLRGYSQQQCQFPAEKGKNVEKREGEKKSAKALLSINTTVKGSDVNSTKAVARGHIIKSAGHRTHFFLLQWSWSLYLLTWSQGLKAGCLLWVFKNMKPRCTSWHLFKSCHLVQWIFHQSISFLAFVEIIPKFWRSIEYITCNVTCGWFNNKQ